MSGTGSCVVYLWFTPADLWLNVTQHRLKNQQSPAVSSTRNFDVAFAARLLLRSAELDDAQHSSSWLPCTDWIWPAPFWHHKKTCSTARRYIVPVHLEATESGVDGDERTVEGVSVAQQHQRVEAERAVCQTAEPSLLISRSKYPRRTFICLCNNSFKRIEIVSLALDLGFTSRAVLQKSKTKSPFLDRTLELRVQLTGTDTACLQRCWRARTGRAPRGWSRNGPGCKLGAFPCEWPSGDLCSADRWPGRKWTSGQRPGEQAKGFLGNKIIESWWWAAAWELLRYQRELHKVWKWARLLTWASERGQGEALVPLDFQMTFS